MGEKRVVILCIGNSCRSQLAEAVVKSDLSGTWQAFRAGTQPAGTVHPLALRALEEIGIQHRGVSKSVECFRGKNVDVILTVCDDAAENCPVWLGKGQRAQFGFPDPAKAEGSDDQKMMAFRPVREAIRSQIVTY